MKLNFKAILYAAVSAFMAASCTEGIIDLRPELQDVEATSVELTTLVSSDAARVRPYNVYTLNLSNADGSVVLDVKFVSDGQPLHAAVYNAATGGVARNTYMTGAKGTKLTLAGVAYQVVDGAIKVTEEAGVYALAGTVAVVPEVVEEGATAQKSYYTLSWTGAEAIKFKELPVMTKLTNLLSFTNNVKNGTNSVTLQLATKDITSEFDMTTYQNVLKGTGNYLAVDFYSEKGYLKPGTYKPSKDPKNPQAGEYVIGYDTTVEFWGQTYEVYDWGTCWWTVTDGKTVDAEGKNTAVKVTAGDIIVALDGNTYTIDIDNGVQLAQFVGEIKDLVEPEKPADPFADMSADIKLEATSGLTIKKVDDTKNNTTAENAPLEGVTLWYVEVAGADGSPVAIFDLVTEPNAESLAGDYTVTSYPDAVGEAGNGFYMDLSAYGYGIMFGGTILYDRAGNPVTLDADTGYIRVTESNGVVTILVKGTYTANNATQTVSGKYVIGGDTEEEGGDEGEEGEGNSCGCDCDGCADCTGPGTGSGDEGEGEEGGEEEVTLTKLTQFISYTDYLKQNSINLVGLEVGTSGLTLEPWTWGEYSGVNVKGTGNTLKIEFYSKDGKLAAGTYTPAKTQGSPAEGEFNFGYDFTQEYEGQTYTSVYGTCWNTYESDQQTAQTKVTDGTATVEVSGDTYTITIKSSVVNAQYVGKLQ